jgi:hypothetical protein
MQPAESTNTTQAADLANELSAAKQDLKETRQERDAYLKALYARLRAEAIAEQEEDEGQMEHPITQPLLEEAIAHLRRQD